MKPVFIGLLVLGLYYLWSGSEISRPPGVLVTDEPYQNEVYTSSLREKNGTGSDF